MLIIYKDKYQKIVEFLLEIFKVRKERKNLFMMVIVIKIILVNNIIMF